ncbi:hypothetical protein Hanom_Chr10g00940701 [Helianthus anomalus]
MVYFLGGGGRGGGGWFLSGMRVLLNREKHLKFVLLTRRHVGSLLLDNFSSLFFS